MAAVTTTTTATGSSASKTGTRLSSTSRAVVMNPAQLLQPDGSGKMVGSGTSKIGLSSKIAPAISKSPINKTNMATGKPITDAQVKVVQTSRVIKSTGGGISGGGGGGSNAISSISLSAEKNDNKKNESIESKRKKEEKLRLKMEKEAKKVHK